MVKSIYSDNRRQTRIYISIWCSILRQGCSMKSQQLLSDFVINMGKVLSFMYQLIFVEKQAATLGAIEEVYS